MFPSSIFYPSSAPSLVMPFWANTARSCSFLSSTVLVHLALAVDHTRIGLVVGLGLIALGAGGIKPCVSANVGDQFGASNQHLLPRVFSWFYFSINFGSALFHSTDPLAAGPV